MQNYPLELLHSMLEIYSPSGSEQRLAEFLHEQMAARGFKVTTDKVGNVVGKLGERGPSILLCGHMDTVSGEIPVRTEGDFLYGRGSVDAKSSLAAMIAGTSIAAAKSSLPLQVTVACLVEEETTSAGARAMIDSADSYDLAVFGEPSGAANIIVGYKGSIQLHVTCLTKGGHSASPWVSNSSFEAASEFWSNFKNSLLENNAESKFAAITGCVTNIVAGGTPNNIPSKAKLTVDVRIPPSVTTNEMAARIEDFVEDYQRKHDGARFLATIEDQTEAYLGRQDSVAVSAFRWAIRKTMEQQAPLVKKTGTSDMNLFAKSHSMPMIAYGPGDSTLDHTENERVSIHEYLNSVKIYSNALRQITHLAQNKVLLTHAK